MADWPTTLEEARALDATDPLSAFRERFVIADPELIYLDGNSLGRLPRATGERLATVAEHEWGERLVRGWGEGWFDAPQRIGGKLAGLLGAAADEVVLADSTSVNLFKLALAGLLARPDRRVIVTDDLNFPSDLYVLESVARLAGGSVRVVPSADGIHGPVEALLAALLELAGDPAQRTALGAAAAQYVAERCAPAVVADAYVAFVAGLEPAV